jgi:hypothetical protein
MSQRNAGINHIAGMLFVGLLAFGSTGMGQTPIETDPRFANPPKNLKVLRVTKPQDLRTIMEHFNDSLGVTCTFCHNRDDFSKETPHIAKARLMIQMVAKINKEIFTWDSPPRATCNMCHNGRVEPAINAPTPRGLGQAAVLRNALPTQ